VTAVLVLLMACAPETTTTAAVPEPEPLAPVQLRIATLNASLSREAAGQLREALEAGTDPQPGRIMDILRAVDPDVLLVNEFDRDEAAAALFAEALGYPHHYLPPTNTGLPSGVDLDGDGSVDPEPGTEAWAGDAFGFGLFEGQYGMLVLSRHPLQIGQARSFQTLRWADVPDNLIPPGFYSDEALAVLRVSSKNHVDLPVDIDGHRLHLLLSHPTPPAFDGPEERNVRRNHDEIRLWVDYLDGAAYLVDDAGVPGGLPAATPFVLLGDLNADPVDGSGRREALLALLDHPRVQDPQPTSEGAVAAHDADQAANLGHTGDPALDTADFSDDEVGNLRVDYALPSTELEVVDSGVFWPVDEPALMAASDHRLVWVDVVVGAAPRRAEMVTVGGR
jgi:alkaline phosphatase D